MKNKLILLLICTTFFTISCVRSSIIDEILFLSILGYGYVDENKICITASTPIFLPDEPARNVTYTTITQKDRHTIGKLQKKANFPIKTGNLMTVLFDQKIAEKQGIIDHILYLKRDPQIGARVFISIVDGDVKELLDGEYGLRGNGHYLQNLFEQNMERRDLPDINIHRFLNDFHNNGKDPVVPIIKQTDFDEVEILGLGLFKDDKLIATVSHNKLFFFKLLADKHTEGALHFHNNNVEIAFKNVRSKVKLKLKLNEKDPYKITITINLKGVLRDYQNGNLSEHNLDKIDEKLQAKIIKESTDLIELFQELEVDPIGLGAFVKSKLRNFDLAQWQENYQSAQIDLKVNVKILNTGTTL